MTRTRTTAAAAGTITKAPVATPRPRTSRRTLLSRGAIATVALPFLRLAERRAQAAVAAKRLIIVATPNGASLDLKASRSTGGTILGPDPDFWSGTGSGFTLGSVMKPLEPLRSKLLMIRGIRQWTVEKRPSPRNHGRHYPNVLVARQPTVPEVGYGPIAGISIDQEIANAVGKSTKFDSLQFGVYRPSNHALMARGYALPVRPETDVPKMFARLFADLVPPTATGQAPDPALVRLQADRRSVLDYVNGELGRLRCELGSDEKRAFDAHIEAMRSLEKQVFFKPADAGAGCRKPTVESFSTGSQSLETTGLGATVVAGFPTWGKNMMNMLVRAAACDLSRVLALVWGGGDVVHGWVDPSMTEGHHSIAHSYPGEARNKWQKPIENWYAQQFFYLCSELDKITDVDGNTLLDNSAVVWIREQGDGQSHLNRNMPYVMAGGCKGFFKRGTAIDFKEEAHNNLLITWAHAMGHPITGFGDPEFSRGPLPQIIA